MARRSTRIRARKTATSADNLPAPSVNTDKLWCSCEGYDDGHLMLWCAAVFGSIMTV